jgi:HAD superfamily hydrolase (TIGR01549 family)
MEIRGVLFDLDGTLADTAAAERDAWPDLAAVIEEHARDVDRAELHVRYTTLFEAHWTDFLEGRIDFGEYRWNRLREAVAPWVELDEPMFEAYRDEKRRSVERLRPFDDAVATIDELRHAGLPVGLLTNGPSWLQRRKLEVTGLGRELDAIAISEEIGVAKPEPAAFHHAAAMLGCDPGTVAMVGDSPVYDIAGAIAAGLAAAVLIGALGLVADGAITVRALADVPTALGITATR